MMRRRKKLWISLSFWPNIDNNDSALSKYNKGGFVNFSTLKRCLVVICDVFRRFLTNSCHRIFFPLRVFYETAVVNVHLSSWIISLMISCCSFSLTFFSGPVGWIDPLISSLFSSIFYFFIFFPLSLTYYITLTFSWLLYFWCYVLHLEQSFFFFFMASCSHSMSAMYSIISLNILVCVCVRSFFTWQSCFLPIFPLISLF